MGEGQLEVKLDTSLNDKLLEEGRVRELARQVQVLRKEASCRLDQPIEVVAPLEFKNKKLVAWFKKQTLAVKVTYGGKLTIKKVG